MSSGKSNLVQMIDALRGPYKAETAIGGLVSLIAFLKTKSESTLSLPEIDAFDEQQRVGGVNLELGRFARGLQVKLLEAMEQPLRDALALPRDELAQEILDLGSQLGRRGRNYGLGEHAFKWLASETQEEENRVYLFDSALAVLLEHIASGASEDLITSFKFQSPHASVFAQALAMIFDFAIEFSWPSIENLENEGVVIACPPLSFRLSRKDEGRPAEYQTLPGFPFSSCEDLAISIVTRAIEEKAIQRGHVWVGVGSLFSRQGTVARQSAVETGALDKVVGFSAGGLRDVGIPTCLLSFNSDQQSNSAVSFYSAPSVSLQKDSDRAGYFDSLSEELSLEGTVTLIERREIAAQGYDLTIGRYIKGDAAQKIAAISMQVGLEGLADLIRPAIFKSAADVSQVTETFLEVTPRDVDSTGQVRSPSKKIELVAESVRRAKSQLLMPGDVLLGVKGNLGLTCQVSDSCGDNWIAGQAFLVIRAKGTVSSDYLFRYLNSEMIQKYLVEIATGSAIRLVRADDIRNLPVEYPTPELKDLIEANRQAILAELMEIERHRQRIAELHKEFWAL